MNSCRLFWSHYAETADKYLSFIDSLKSSDFEVSTNPCCLSWEGPFWTSGDSDHKAPEVSFTILEYKKIDSYELS